MSFLIDDRGINFQDKRKCYQCSALIKITEDYDYEVTFGRKHYTCEKCLEAKQEN